MEKPNLSYIKALSGNDTAFEKKLLDIIKLEFPEEKKEFFSNILAKKLENASKNVHKLKHKISILGLEKSYKIAEEFEKNLLEGSLSLQEEFEAVLGTITDYLKTA